MKYSKSNDFINAINGQLKEDSNIHIELILKKYGFCDKISRSGEWNGKRFRISGSISLKNVELEWEEEIYDLLEQLEGIEINELGERLEVKNLLGIYSSLTNSTLQNSVKIFAGKNFSEFKESLAAELVNKIEPISKEIKKLLEDRRYLDEILLDGVEKANFIASKKIERIKEIVGF